MTTITANMVKELRERTGAGMMDCKTALTETKGDMEAAIDWLRKKGIAKSAKKSGRVAAEGLVGVLAQGKTGAVVEVNSETDFVARNEQFQDMVRRITTLAPAAKGDVAKLLAAKFPGKSESVEAVVKEAIATIGENMTVRRTTTIEVKDGVVAEYIHNRVADGLGKLGVLVALESTGDKAKLNELGRMIAMHVAAANPVALDLESVPADIMAREKAILTEKNAGKKPEVMEKIMASSLKSYAKDFCLVDQAWIHDNAKSVAQAAKEHEKAVGAPIKIKGYVRFALGDGVEKKEEDFAAEVAATMKG